MGSAMNPLLRRYEADEMPEMEGDPSEDPVMGYRGQYPHEIELRRIREWPASDLRGLFSYVQERWFYPECWSEIETADGTLVEIATSGWSGNEELLGALAENYVAHAMTWQESRRGGAHKYIIPKGERR